MDEPLLLITPNPLAMKLLSTLLDEEDTEDGEPCWETTLTLRITKEDLYRCMYGNGDLATIAFWIQDDGVEVVAFPDPETPRSPFEEQP